MDIGKKVKEYDIPRPIRVPNWPQKQTEPIRVPDWPVKQPAKVPQLDSK